MLNLFERKNKNWKEVIIKVDCELLKQIKLQKQWQRQNIFLINYKEIQKNL